MMEKEIDSKDFHKILEISLPQKLFLSGAKYINGRMMEREIDSVWFYVLLQLVQHVSFAIFNGLFPQLNAWGDPGTLLYGFCWNNQLFLDLDLQF